MKLHDFNTAHSLVMQEQALTQQLNEAILAGADRRAIVDLQETLAATHHFMNAWPEEVAAVKRFLGMMP